VIAGPQGPRLDLDNEATEAWLVERGHDLEIFEVEAPRPSQVIAAELGDKQHIDLSAIGGMPFREVTEQYGTSEQFHGWVRARKEMAMAKRAEEQLARYKGMLIPLTLVDHIFGHIDRLHRMLLTDAAETLAGRLSRAQ